MKDDWLDDPFDDTDFEEELKLPDNEGPSNDDDNWDDDDDWDDDDLDLSCIGDGLGPSNGSSLQNGNSNNGNDVNIILGKLFERFLIVFGAIMIILLSVWGCNSRTDEIKKLIERAQKNDSKAQLQLGLCYEEGNGVEQDLKKAFDWYQKASKQNNEMALLKQGNCFYFGKGTEKNVQEAVKCYKSAARQGLPEAQFVLGNCYFTGQGLEPDKAEAEVWYRRAANKDYAPAQYNLGVCYIFGYGVMKDPEAASDWFKKAAKQGNESARSNLELCKQKAKDGYKGIDLGEITDAQNGSN